MLPIFTLLLLEHVPLVVEYPERILETDQAINAHPFTLMNKFQFIASKLIRARVKKTLQLGAREDVACLFARHMRLWLSASQPARDQRR